jgi:ActR/RegA family two-component response regulator
MPEITLLDRKLVRPVLIVEAEAAVLETLKRHIRPTGLPVCSASSIKGARDLLAATTPIAAVLDLRLFSRDGGGEGLDLLEAMRADSPTTRFFFLANASEQTRLDGVRTDGIFDPSDLRPLIQELHRLAMA